MLGESNLHLISPKTPAPQYQPLERKKNVWYYIGTIIVMVPMNLILIRGVYTLKGHQVRHETKKQTQHTIIIKGLANWFMGFSFNIILTVRQNSKFRNIFRTAQKI